MTQAETNDLPDGILISWYGDDFTGSAAVMEVLSFAGLPSVLFLDIPTAEQLANFPGQRGIGIAGTARSHSPNWMKKSLPEVFNYLRELNAPITHYKVCSTLDSSPSIGSIGQAVDLAQPIFQSPWIPLLLAAPAIRRYQAFGHLFAGASDGVYRLDRHPVMACHPVTPMTESDVAKHISQQTRHATKLVDLEMLATPSVPDPIQSAAGEIIALDTITEQDLTRVGQLIWENRTRGLFSIGSQGIEYALVSHWIDAGKLARQPAPSGAGTCKNIVVVSGSVSSVTAGQIDWALDNGFAPVRLDANAVLDGTKSSEKAIGQAVDEAIEALETGHSPIVFTARGPDDPAVQGFHRLVADTGGSVEVANNHIGAALGEILNKILLRSDVRRAVISGGDTSGHATRKLEIYALTALAPTVPGAALFQAHSENQNFRDLQLALKGGQMGTVDYFGWIKRGGGAA